MGLHCQGGVFRPGPWLRGWGLSFERSSGRTESPLRGCGHAGSILLRGFVRTGGHESGVSSRQTSAPGCFLSFTVPGLVQGCGRDLCQQDSPCLGTPWPPAPRAESSLFSANNPVCGIGSQRQRADTGSCCSRSPHCRTAQSRLSLVLVSASSRQDGGPSCHDL